MQLKNSIVKICLLIILFFTSCKSKKYQGNTEEDYYIIAYKSAVFKGCLNEITDKGFSKLLMEHNDLGGYTDVEILLHGTYLEASERGKKYSLTIKPVSLPDAENKMPGYLECFRYAMSREIDSTARAEFKKSKNGKWTMKDE